MAVCPCTININPVIVRAGLYCSGWLKRGPTGEIATTMNDSFETARILLKDVETGGLDLSIKKDGAQEISILLKARGKKHIQIKCSIIICTVTDVVPENATNRSTTTVNTYYPSPFFKSSHKHNPNTVTIFYLLTHCLNIELELAVIKVSNKSILTSSHSGLMQNRS